VPNSDESFKLFATWRFPARRMDMFAGASGKRSKPMAASDTPVFEVNPNPPPRPFAVAAWLGISQEDIVAGLRNGSIAPPPGAPPDWVPPGFNMPLGNGPSLGLASDSIGDGGWPNVSASNNADAESSTGGSLLERARVRGWLHALDATLDDTAFESIWKHAGDSDNVRAANLTGFLARALLGGSMPGSGILGEHAPKTPAEIASALSAFTADTSHRAQVVDLSNMDGAELARRARTDIGYRYALTQFDSIALTGNRALFTTANADGHLDRFDPDTGESNLSEAWLSDRGKFLAWKLAGDSGTSLPIAGDQAWTFIDRARLDSDGQPLTLKLAPSNRDAQQNTVIFGAESAEVIKGGVGTDRIYGGGGDDVMRGAAGADHLEGGRGDDIAFGGSGNDELAGNQGNDELDGGRGSDSLDGGSGDDTLTGGRGDDHLAGGDGADTYVIDAGDGTDTIIDSDGQGSIELNDVTISGAAGDANGTWTSKDGRVNYSVDGDITGESTLTIRAFGSDSGAGGSPDNVIQVQHWHNGDLGIALGGSRTVDASFDQQDPAAPNPKTEVIVDNIPLDGMADPVTGANAGNGAETSDGQISPTEAPILEASVASRPLDANDAISQLLAPPNNDVAALNPSQLQQAVAAFSGVLAPPDVSFGGSTGGDYGSNAVSIADVAGALAADAGGHDVFGELAAGQVRLAPDWHHIEAISVPVDGGTRSARFGIAGVQP
jgi:hypothetical protein